MKGGFNMDRLFVVIIDDGEPVIFRNSLKAYRYIKDCVIEHGKSYNYEKQEISESLDELSETFVDFNKTNYFGTYLGDFEAHCYASKIED
jgi:hypothetical protein